MESQTRAARPPWIVFVSMILGLAFVPFAQAAYLQADLPAPNADPNVGTHLIIAGNGMEAGDQWLQAAHTQALIFKDRRKHGAIRVIAAIMNSNTVPMFQRWGYTNIQVFQQTMTGDAVVDLIKQVPIIGSLDFIGHNGALLGYAMEDYNHRFFMNQMLALLSVRDHFTRDSFIRLMGCNTGWYLAPWAAEELAIPVAGVLTAADIQRVHSSGDWFYDEPGGVPASGRFTGSNSISYSSTVPCLNRGGCVRLKAVTSSYTGRHGNYLGTLPFEKFFCGTMDPNDCFRRMALSTRYLVGVRALNEKPSLADFSATLADQFCAAWPDPVAKRSCVAKIAAHLSGAGRLSPTFTTASSPSLTCDFRGCRFRQDCTSGTCLLQSTGPAQSDTFVKELDAYKIGFGLW